MTVEIRLPDLGPDGAAATLVKWHVAPGAAVSAGDVLAEIESDKAVVELTAERDGVIERLLVAEGTADLGSGHLLAVLGEAGAGVQPAAPPATPDAVAPGNGAPADPAPAPRAPEPRAAPAATPEHASGRAAPRSGATFATPLARHLARVAGVRLDGLSGSGEGGRITAADVRSAWATDRPAAVRSVPAGDAGVRPDATGRPIYHAADGRGVPQLHLTIECRAEALCSLPAALGAEGDGPTAGDLLLAVVARALAHVPGLNASWTGDGVQHHDRVDLAFAVASRHGLVTAVLPAAGTLRLSEIAAQTRALAARADRGELSAPECRGGTFAVADLGALGVDEVAAAVEAPRACVLAIGAVREAPVSRGGDVASGRVVSMTLTADRRVTDGAEAARFLAEVRRLVEDPRRLVL